MRASLGVAMAAALALGACGGGASLNPGDWLAALNRPAGALSGEGDLGFTVSRTAPDAPFEGPVVSSDLVAADGTCTGEGGAGGITLAMTECQLVATAGAPDKVDIGATEQGERRVILTYGRGAHAGVYTFVSGRLRVIDAVAAPQRPEPRRRAPRPPQRSA